MNRRDNNIPTITRIDSIKEGEFFGVRDTKERIVGVENYPEIVAFETYREIPDGTGFRLREYCGWKTGESLVLICPTSENNEKYYSWGATCAFPKKKFYEGSPLYATLWDMMQVVGKEVRLKSRIREFAEER